MLTQLQFHQRRENLQAEGLAADGVEVRQFQQAVKVERVPVALDLDGVRDLFTEAFLRVWPLGEELQDARERVRGRVHARENHCPERYARATQR